VLLVLLLERPDASDDMAQAFGAVPEFCQPVVYLDGQEVDGLAHQSRLCGRCFVWGGLVDT